MCSDLDQMESIVKQFMAYVRQGEAELEVVNISDTVRHVIAANRVASQPDIQLLTSIEDGLEVRANPTDLARAVQNMIGQCRQVRPQLRRHSPSVHYASLFEEARSSRIDCCR